MIVPNKAVAYNESLLSKLPEIMQNLGINQIPAFELYQKTRESFTSLSQFMMAVDMLFILEKVELVSGDIKNVN